MLFAVIFLGVIFLYFLLCYVCFRVACVRGRPSDRTRETFRADHILAPFADRFREAGEWLDAQKTKPIYIESFDGLRLYADYLPLEGSRKTIVAMHGYHSSYRSDFSIVLPYYRELGYNILLVDQRAHGQSEGRYLSYGILEKYDVLSWVNELNRRFPETETIVLDGMSMGASTVLMATGLELPENVRAVVADCGFSGGWDIVNITARKINRHIPKVVLSTVNFFCRIFADYDLRDDNTLLAMQKCKIPVLFVHGTGDTFVPCEMTLRNYATCRAKKELLTVVGAEHGMSFLRNEPLCRKTLSAFLKKYGDVPENRSNDESQGDEEQQNPEE